MALISQVGKYFFFKKSTQLLSSQKIHNGCLRMKAIKEEDTFYYLSPEDNRTESSQKKNGHQKI